MTLRLLVVLLAALVAAPGAAQPASIRTVAPTRGHAFATQGAVRPSSHPWGANTPTVRQAAYFRGLKAKSGKRAPFMGRGRIPTSSPTAANSPRTPLTVATGVGLFNNLNAAGMASDGNETPPDSTGAIGPNDYVEMDNSNIAVYDRNLNLISTVSLDTFTGSSPGVPFCDPQVQWDPAAQRFLFSFLYCNLADTPNQAFFFGWTATADPTNLASGWCEFGAGTGTLLLDFDKLGHSSKYLVVGGNLYDVSVSSSNPPFISAGMAWFKMPASGDSSCTTPSSGANTLPQKNGDGSTLTFTPVPVNTTSSAGDVWIVSAYDPAGNVSSFGPKTKLATWDLDSTGVLHARSDITVNSYQAPTPASQSGSGDLIDTSDGRLTQAVGDPSGGIYTQHTVLNLNSDSQVDWYELKQSGTNLTLVQQGHLSGPSNTWFFNAAISPRFDGKGAAIFYNVSSTTSDPSIVAQIRISSTTTGQWEPGTRTLATSAAPVTETLSCNVGGFPCRWGDYSGASPDPVNTGVVWGTNMFNTASGASPAWSDENFAVVVGPPPHAPVTVSAAPDGRGSAVVTWTPSTFDPETAITGYTINVYADVVVVKTVTVTGASTLAGEVTGLTNGLDYTFTVVANDVAGPSPESGHTGIVHIGGINQASPAPTPSSRGVAPEPTATPPPR